MKAIQILKPGSLEEGHVKLVEIDRPIPKKNELLIRVHACGVCRTDLHIAEGDIKQGSYPCIPGHQVVGVVEEMGEGTTKFKKGDRVGVAWLAHTCNSCFYCQKQKENLCPESKYTGYQIPGGYAEFLSADENYVYPLNSPLSDEEIAPLLCAGIIGYRAFKRSNIQKKETLGLYGFGSSAHLIMQLAKSDECSVFVATRDPKHRELAKTMGADFVGGAYDDFPEKIDSAIIFAPAGEIVPIALKALKPGGTCALAGIHMSDIPKMTYEECLFHEKNLVSVEANTRDDGQEFLKRAFEIPIKPSIEIFSLQEAPAALKKLKEDAISGSAVLKIS